MEEAKRWLNNDCRKCVYYPNCIYIETKWKENGLKFPRGCSMWHENKKSQQRDDFA